VDGRVSAADRFSEAGLFSYLNDALYHIRHIDRIPQRKPNGVHC
jgi:hypothetical protein